MLSVLQAKAAEPRDKAYKLSDAHGLYLFVTPRGTKSWRFKYRRDGKERLLIFGRFPEITLAAARETREAAKRALKEGRDPAIEIEAQKRLALVATSTTFRTVAQQWLADHEVHWSPSNAVRVRNRVERDLLDRLGGIPARDFRSDMILERLRNIEARGSIETAKRVKGYVLAILKRARAEKLVSSDLIDDIELLGDALKPNPPAKKLPAFTTVAELLSFQQAVDRSSAHLLTKLASRFLALTMVRISALRLATWSEFQGVDWEGADTPVEKAIWNIPPEHMKLATADKENADFGHMVPLSRQAVEVLRAIQCADRAVRSGLSQRFRLARTDVGLCP